MNSIEAPQTDCYFFRDGDGDNSVVEGVTLKPAEPRFNLAFGQVVDRMQERRLRAKEQERQCVPKNVQMSMDNVRPAFFENRWQSVVHAVIKSGLFPQVQNFNASIFQQTIEVATQTARERNDCRFKTLPVQPSHDMNRHTLGATGAQHWNYMHDSDLLHDLSSSLVGNYLSLGPHAGHEDCSQDRKALRTIHSKIGLERSIGLLVDRKSWIEKRDSHDRHARNRCSLASARPGARLGTERFRDRLPHCAINSPKKNQVGFRISHVKLDTPTTQTARDTIHSLCWKGGSALSDSAMTPSKAQKSARPTTPCSTRTDRKVLCAGGAGSCSSRRIGSAKTRLTISRNAFAPIPRKGCTRKISQPALQMMVRPVNVPCVNSLGTVDKRSHEVEGTKERAPATSKAIVSRSAIL